MADRYLQLLPSQAYRDWYAAKNSKTKEHQVATIVEAAVVVDDLVEWLITEASCSKIKTERSVVKKQQKKGRPTIRRTRLKLLVSRLITKARNTANADERERFGAKNLKSKAVQQLREAPLSKMTRLKFLVGKLIAKARSKAASTGKREQSGAKNLKSEAVQQLMGLPLTELTCLQILANLGGSVRVTHEQNGPTPDSREFHAQAELGIITADARGCNSKKETKRSAALKCLQEYANLNLDCAEPIVSGATLQRLAEMGGTIRVVQKGPKHAPVFHADADLGGISHHATDTKKKTAKRRAAVKCLQEHAMIKLD